MTTLIRTLLIAALSVPTGALAQDAPADTSKAQKPSEARKEKLSEDELQIIAQYHEDNLMEIELGTLAMKRGTSQEVKAYGEMLVKNHGDYDKKLQALVKKSGQAIPKAKPADAQEEKDKQETAKKSAEIKKLKGADFDRAYLSFMVEDHSRALADIDARIAAVQSTELASMLREVKPILQRHYERARELSQKQSQAVK